MSRSTTITEEDLFGGKPLPTQTTELVVGEDFYGGDRDELDSSMNDQSDPISVAIGLPGYMADHMVQQCFETFAEGAQTEPEVFDRFYFHPDDGSAYEGPAPCLLDILKGDTPEELAQEAIDKHVEFKTRWCREHEIRYAVLNDIEDLFLGPERLRNKIMGEETVGTAAAEGDEAPEPKRGVQHPQE